MTDDDARQSHRADRLRRAWALVKAGKVQRLGGTQFRVAGNVEEFYYIDLSAELPCQCRDIEFRSGENKGMCKHRLAARLASMDMDVVEIIATWLEVEQAQADAVSRAPKQRAGAAATRRTG